MPAPTTWRKSSFSEGGNSACIEISSTLDKVRDSKAPGQVLEVPVRALIRAVRGR